jgi:hypothetical protein
MPCLLAEQLIRPTIQTPEYSCIWTFLPLASHNTPVSDISISLDTLDEVKGLDEAVGQGPEAGIWIPFASCGFHFVSKLNLLVGKADLHEAIWSGEKLSFRRRAGSARAFVHDEFYGGEATLCLSVVAISDEEEAIAKAALEALGAWLAGAEALYHIHVAIS